VCFLTRQETEALLAAPDTATWHGRRDHALLLLATQTGLRVSELTGLTVEHARLGTGPHVYCRGKGRKERCTPLTAPTVATLTSWLAERGGHGQDPLFCTRPGGRLSRDAVERLLAKHVATATIQCPSLQAKTVSPHTLRHSAAMALLHAGVDITVIALWLGHESTTATRAYLHADMAMKERALARTTPPGTQPGRYKAPDSLLAFLDGL
jgi:integrase/recombinase XerD